MNRVLTCTCLFVSCLAVTVMSSNPRSDCHNVVHHHRATSVLQRKAHHAQTIALLHPLEDAALQMFNATRYVLSQSDHDSLVARLATPLIAVAHSLVSTHDEFEDACRDHHWEGALAKTFCELLLEADASFTEAIENAFCSALTELTAFPVVRCMCRGMRELVHACAAGVVPWAHEGSYCASAGLTREDSLDLHGEYTGCAASNPFVGFCLQHQPHRSDRSNANQRAEGAKGTKGNGNRPKMTHESWDMRTRRAQHDRWMADAHRRLRHEKTSNMASEHLDKQPVPQAQRRAAVRSARTQAARRTDGPVHHDTPEFALLVLFESKHTAARLRACRGCSVCVPRTTPLLATHVGKIYSDAVVSAVDGEADLLDHLGPAGCEAVAVWRAQAELSHLHRAATGLPTRTAPATAPLVDPGACTNTASCRTRPSLSCGSPSTSATL